MTLKLAIKSKTRLPKITSIVVGLAFERHLHMTNFETKVKLLKIVSTFVFCYLLTNSL